jgi:hypothetical protein
MDHYIICNLFLLFLVENMDLLGCRAHFSGRSYFGDLGSLKFQGFVWGISLQTLIIVLHIDSFPTIQISP